MLQIPNAEKTCKIHNVSRTFVSDYSLMTNNKEKILQTALRLFAERGYNGTPTSLVAKEASVSEGLIFRHFSSKSGLLEAIILEGLAQIAETMRPYETTMEPRKAILEHIDQSMRLMREQTLFWRLVQQVRFQPAVMQVAGSRMEQVNEFVMTRLTGHFQKLGAHQPALEAAVLFALIDGISIHFLQDPERYPLDAIAQSLKNRYINETFLG